MHIAIAVLPMAIWTLCALTDIARFKIPNPYVLILFAGWPAAAFLAPLSLGEAAGALILFAGTLAAGIALYAGRLLGAGDAKLLAVSALWIGPGAASTFFFYTAVAGAVLGVLLIAGRRVPLPEPARSWRWARALHAEERLMPYGVAIAAGGILSFPVSALMAG